MNLISSFASTLGGSFQKQSSFQPTVVPVDASTVSFSIWPSAVIFCPPLHHLYWMLAMSNHFPSHNTFLVLVYFAMQTLTMFDMNKYLQLSLMFIALDTRSWCYSRLFYKLHTGLYCLYRFFPQFCFQAVMLSLVVLRFGCHTHVN